MMLVLHGVHVFEKKSILTLKKNRVKYIKVHNI